MTNEKSTQHSWWKVLRAWLRTNTGLAVIIIAALLLEFTTGVMYYSAQNIIQRTVERLVRREMNAIVLCIRNKLDKVEVTVDNLSWVVSDSLNEPDWLFGLTEKMVRNNSSFLGLGISFVPGYYPQKDRFFEPYAVRRGADSIQSIQLGADGVDHTGDEYFRVPFTQGEAHWTEPYMDTEGALAFVTTYGVPVCDDKAQKVGVVYADISLDFLDVVINESMAYKSTQRFLVTGNYNLLAGRDCPIFRAAQTELKSDADKLGYVILNDERGKKQHVYFTPVGGMTDWMLISVLDDGDVYSKLRRIRISLLLPLIIGLVFVGFIIYRSSRNLERLRKANAEKERIGGELRVASLIQQSMLPHSPLKREDVDILGALVPAREVGGDLFDYYIRDEKLFFCMGDVSGKGAPSAMLMGVVHSLFRAFSAHESNPAKIMKAINDSSCQGNESNMFVTLFIGVLDLPTGLLRYCDAGHDAPIILSKKCATALEVIPHLPVGVFDDVNYSQQEIQLEGESTIFLYTDGLTEARDQQQKQFGLERVQSVLTTCFGKAPKDVLDAVTATIHEFVKDAEQSDDLTMLAILYTPKAFESTLSETLVIKNNIKEVSKFSEFMKSVTSRLGIEKSLARRLQLAVEEAVVNVIDYAYPAGTEGSIEVRVMSDATTLRCQIIDSGVAFDPTMKEKADTTLSVEDRQIGGLGILLVREFMDTINYERTEGKNVLTLVKKIED